MDVMEVDYKKIGQRIKAARKKHKGLTQEQLALNVDVTPSHMSHIETGQTKLALSTIVKIANELSVSVDELLCDSLVKSKPIYDQKFAEVLADCNTIELQAMLDIIKSTKTAIRKARKSEEY